MKNGIGECRQTICAGADVGNGVSAMIACRGCLTLPAKPASAQSAL